MSIVRKLKKFFFNLSLSRKISFIFLVVIIIPLIISNIWIVILQKKVYRKELEKELQHQISFFQRKIKEEVKNSEVELLSLFQEDDNLFTIAQENMAKATYLARRFIFSKNYGALYLFNQQKEIILDVSLENININNFKEVRERLVKSGVNDLRDWCYHFYEDGLYLFIEIPFIYRGKVNFVVLIKVIPWFKIRGWGNFSEYQLSFFKNNKVIWTSIFREDSTRDMSRRVPASIYKNLTLFKGSYFYQEEIILWNKYLCIYQAMSRQKKMIGIISIGVSLNKYYRNIWFLRKILYGTSLVVLFLVFLSSYFLSRFITKPLGLVVEKMDRVMDGDYDFDIHYTSGDEIGDLINRFKLMVYQLQEREKMKKYLSKRLLKRIETGALIGGEAGELKVVKNPKTVLFSDIRDFTTLTEKVRPEEVFEILNKFYNVVTQVATKYNGIVDKYMGDSVMLLFESDNAEYESVLAALEIREEFSKLEEEIKFKDWIFEAGIGIASGYVIEGSMGNEIFKDYTVVGDAVNLASRLEKLSQKGNYSGIFVNDSVYQKVSPFIYAQEMFGIKIKGKNYSSPVYEIICLKNREELEAALNSSDKLVVESAIRMIGASSNIEFLDKILSFLKCEDVILRSVAIETLWSFYRKFRKHDRDGSIKEKISFFLVALLFRETDSTIRARVIRILGRLGDESLLKKFTVFLDDEDNRVRANAIEVMGKIRDYKFLRKEMMALVYDGNHRVKSAVLEILWKLKEYELVLREIEKMLDDENPYVQSAAIYLIGNLLQKKDYSLYLKEFLSETEKELKIKKYFEKLENFLKKGFQVYRDVSVLRQLLIATGKSGRGEFVFWIIEQLNEENYPYLKVDFFRTLEKLGVSVEDIELIKIKLENKSLL